jgi:hypothetical protein
MPRRRTRKTLTDQNQRNARVAGQASVDKPQIPTTKSFAILQHDTGKSSCVLRSALANKHPCVAIVTVVPLHRSNPDNPVNWYQSVRNAGDVLPVLNDQTANTAEAHPTTPEASHSFSIRDQTPTAVESETIHRPLNWQQPHPTHQSTAALKHRPVGPVVPDRPPASQTDS